MKTSSVDGFTLVEMMCVILILGILTSLVAVRMNFLGPRETQELEQFQGFLKVEHSRALQNGISRKIQFLPGKNQVKILTNRLENSRTFSFDFWDINHEEIKTLHITPTGVFGLEQLELKHESNIRHFTIDRLLGVIPEPQSNELGS